MVWNVGVFSFYYRELRKEGMAKKQGRMDSDDAMIWDENRYKGRIDLNLGNVLYERKFFIFLYKYFIFFSAEMTLNVRHRPRPYTVFWPSYR